MMRTILLRTVLTTAVSAAGLSLGAPARAAICGVSGAATTSIGSFNPFSSSGLNEVSVPLTLTKFTQGSERTRRVNFFLLERRGQETVRVRHQGEEIVQTLSRAPRLSVDRPASGTVFHDFGSSANAPDTVTLPLTVTVPAGADLTAGAPLTFDLVYVCDGVGGISDVVFPIILPQALSIDINVASALQASWAGPALNFGEIGNLDNAAAAQRAVTGAVRVASSGPYSVSVRSENAYRMTYPGGSPDDPQQRVSYAVNFMGRAASPDAPRTLEALCRRAGLSGKNLPLSVRLLEGGSDKAAASAYKDILTITVTPLAASYSGALQDCP